MWLTVSDGYRESQQMGRASLLLKARTNKMLMKMLMLRRMLVLVLPMMWLLVVVGILGERVKMLSNRSPTKYVYYALDM